MCRIGDFHAIMVILVVVKNVRFVSNGPYTLMFTVRNGINLVHAFKLGTPCRHVFPLIAMCGLNC